MLVLSRRPGEKVVFPSLGITIEILRSRGAISRLGIEAPDDVPVVRDEVVSRSASDDRNTPFTLSAADRQTRHDWHNKLNRMMLRLQLLQRQLELGLATDPELHLDELFSELSNLEQATTDAVVKSASPKVLIVEDQPNERELLATCLRLGGIDVATAGNGREAFNFLHEHELPDLILLDMRMPEVDGPTFLKSLRDDIRLHELRVFAVSGSSRSEFDAEPLPVDGWISKPVRIDALLRAVCPERLRSTVTA